MKIGIVTHWTSHDNFGQQLQLFALHEKLKQLGHNPFLIRYDRTRDATGKCNWLKIFNPIAVFKKIKRILNHKKNQKNIETQPSRHFDEFRKNYINESELIYSKEGLQTHPVEADAYCTGSDQVWLSCNPIEFLDFGKPETFRFSYAASFGLSSFSKKEMQIKADYIKKLDAVSVREQEGLALCHQMGRHDAVCVLDPTMLHNFAFYCSKFKLEKKTPAKKYCVLYLLADVKGITVDEIYDFAQLHEMEVKYVDTHGQNNDYPKIYPTTEEWLELILNAEFVITNSFHCGVFSVLLHKNFCCIPKGFSDERLTTLLGRVGLVGNIFHDNMEECLNRQIDYVEVERQLDIQREESIQWLRNTLNC